MSANRRPRSRCRPRAWNAGRPGSPAVFAQKNADALSAFVEVARRAPHVEQADDFGRAAGLDVRDEAGCAAQDEVQPEAGSAALLVVRPRRALLLARPYHVVEDALLLERTI